MGSNVAHVTLNIVVLKALRLAGGDSQKTLAERAGISENAYLAIELGKSQARVSTVKKLADALSVPVGAITDSERQAG